MATWNRAAIAGFVRILVGCFFGKPFSGRFRRQLRHMSNPSIYSCRVETAAFHAGVVLACYAVLKLLPSPRSPVSGIREQFRWVCLSQLTDAERSAAARISHRARPPLHGDMKHVRAPSQRNCDETPMLTRSACADTPTSRSRYSTPRSRSSSYSSASRSGARTRPRRAWRLTHGLIFTRTRQRSRIRS